MEKSHKKKGNNLRYERRVIFNSRTFNSKLFLKLTGHFIHPSIVCVQTLRYERDNRKLIEIEKALPWLKTFPDLMNVINLKETPESSHKLLIELTWLLFYQYYKKNIMFNKAAEKGEYFSILLKGKILKLDMVFKREYLTVEEYLIYLFKMKLTREKEILKKCRILNSFYADIDGENLTKFIKENPQFNYDKLKEIAKNEIIKLGFRLEDFQEGRKKKIISSIDNYLKITEIKRNTKEINNILATPKFYIGSYQKAGYITKGMAIGNLTQELTIDNSTYITYDNCDIVYLNKKTSKMQNLYELIKEKRKRVLSEYKNSFYIFREMTENSFTNEIIPHFEYKLFHKGDKIFLQDSLNEGIYLMKSGKVNLYLNSSIMELSIYISKIKNSLKGFKEFISSIKLFKEQHPSESELLKSNIIQNMVPSEKKHLYIQKKYDILTINDSSIFGTNELYNHQTGLYYFTAECATKEAIIYYLPKKYFYDILQREKAVYLAVAETVETKAKFIIEKMKLILKWYEINKTNNKDKKDIKERNNSENKEDSKKSFTVFNNYKNSINNIRRNNIFNYPGLKLYTKTDEKTFEFPILLKDQYFKDKKLFTETIYNNKESHKTLRDKLINNSCNKKKMVKTLNSITGHSNKNINKRNKTFEDKLFLNKTKTIFKKNIKLKLPLNFPFNVQNEFPTIVKNKNKNHNIKYMYTNPF